MREEIRLRIPLSTVDRIGYARALSMGYYEVLDEARSMGWTGEEALRTAVDAALETARMAEDKLAFIAWVLTEADKRDRISWVHDPAVNEPVRPRALVCVLGAGHRKALP